jgi:hypothetical protein
MLSARSGCDCATRQLRSVLNTFIETGLIMTTSKKTSAAHASNAITMLVDDHKKVKKTFQGF